MTTTEQRIAQLESRVEALEQRSAPMDESNRADLLRYEKDLQVLREDLSSVIDSASTSLLALRAMSSP